jgi:hypothetical protein
MKARELDDAFGVRRSGSSWIVVAGIVAVILFGIGLRAFILTHSLSVADSDESVTGLMARHLGDLPVFAWETNYAGNLEALIIGLAFVIFGSSVLVMKLTITALHVVACLLLWRVGRRLIDERAGVVAGLALWVWPGVYVWWSTKARDYEVLLVCGLAVLLCALRLVQESTHRRDWLAFGFASGVGWWTNPQIGYLAAPAVAWIVIANRRAILSALWALPAFLVGAFPWIVWNVRYDWGSLYSTFEAAEGYGARLYRFWNEGIPMALGLRVPYELRWLFAGARVVVLLAVIAGVISLLTRRGGAVLLAVALVAYPLIHALTPVSGYTGEGRYLYLYSPLLALLVAHAARHRIGVGVAFGLMVTVTIGQLTTMGSGTSGMASNLPVPKEMGPLIRTLQQERIDAVWANYWIAYRLTFVSQEKIVAAAGGDDRYPPYEQHVRRSPRTAWVYVAGSLADQRFTAALEQQGVAYRSLRPGKFAVHIPDRPVFPERVPLN